MSIDWSQLITKEAKDQAVIDATKSAIAARRYQSETAGIVVNGINVDTGRGSQAMITGATVAAMNDPTYVCNWKTPDGFVSLDAPTLIAIAQQIRAHVQAAFDRESELLIALAGRTYAAAMIEEGWPDVAIPE